MDGRFKCLAAQAQIQKAKPINILASFNESEWAEPQILKLKVLGCHSELRRPLKKNMKNI